MANDDEPFVIGRQAADAAAADAAHVRAPAPFPWPEGAYARGDHNLLRVPPAPFDDALTAYLRRAAAGGANVVGQLRDALGAGEFDTLLSFGNRAAVRAMRERDVAIVRDGLVAVAIMDPSRIDSRDAGLSLSLLQHAARRIDADARALFADASTLASPSMATLMTESVTPEAMAVPLNRRTWLAEQPTPWGPGFISRGTSRYEPLLPLEEIAGDVATMLDADAYQPDIELAQYFPSIWLSDGVMRTLGREIAGALGLVKPLPVSAALAAIRATVVVRGEVREDTVRDDATRSAQSLWVWITEVADDDAARTLQAASERPTVRGVHRVGVQHGRVFALIVATSSVGGMPVWETGDRLRRFEAPLREILARRLAA